MKYLKRYNELNEGLRDKMVGKSEEDILKYFDGLSHIGALVKAADNNVSGVIKSLFKKHSYNIFELKRALSIAAEKNNDDAKNEILKHETLQKYLKSINKNDKVYKGISYNIPWLVQMGIDEGFNNHLYGATYLVRAITSNYYDIVKVLLENGANPKSENNLPLISSIFIANDLKISKLLVEYGADLNHGKDTYDDTSYNGKDGLEIVRKLEQSLNEGLRDKMVGKPIDNILNKIKDLPYNSKIEKMIQYGIPDEYFPRNNEGWCVYNGDLIINHIFSDEFNSPELPSKFIVNGSLEASLANLHELPQDLIVNGEFDCSFNFFTELPNGLKVKHNLLVSENQLTELPDDLIVGGTLYIINNELPSDVKKPEGVNEMIN
ncbi:MAG: ankyrin repeat domain-containing protein [bacterium]